MTSHEHDDTQPVWESRYPTRTLPVYQEADLGHGRGYPRHANAPKKHKLGPLTWTLSLLFAALLAVPTGALLGMPVPAVSTNSGGLVKAPSSEAPATSTTVVRVIQANLQAPAEELLIDESPDPTPEPTTTTSTTTTPVATPLTPGAFCSVEFELRYTPDGTEYRCMGSNDDPELRWRPTQVEEPEPTPEPTTTTTTAAPTTTTTVALEQDEDGRAIAPQPSFTAPPPVNPGLNQVVQQAGDSLTP